MSLATSCDFLVLVNLKEQISSKISHEHLKRGANACELLYSLVHLAQFLGVTKVRWSISAIFLEQIKIMLSSH